MPVADRTEGQEEPGIAVRPSSASLKSVSWSPPPRVKPVTNDKIIIYRDPQGVIHITNVTQGGEEPATPVSPAAVVQTLPLKEAPPTVRQVSCPELGPEVANYLEAKLLSHTQTLTGKTIQRYKDRRDVWHIRNDPSQDLQLPQARFASSTGEITAPLSAHDPPAPLTSPAMAWGAGAVRPPPGARDQQVVARRDRHGVLHVISCASAEVMLEQNSPLYFLGRVSPSLQACIIEAAQLYRLPISLVLAIIQKESNFAHQAVSPKGAMGLMQLMPGTAASLGVCDPFDPRENILAGCRYFRSLLDYFQGNVPLALAGYNAGYHRVISAGYQVPAIKETQAFVTQVMGLYYLLEKQANSL
jgi:soluble lytic murein transglycosylase-like protein